MFVSRWSAAGLLRIAGTVLRREALKRPRRGFDHQRVLILEVTVERADPIVCFRRYVLHRNRVDIAFHKQPERCLQHDLTALRHLFRAELHGVSFLIDVFAVIKVCFFTTGA